jgi:hypothetical protein
MPAADTAAFEQVANAANREDGRRTVLRNAIVDTAMLAVECECQPGVTVILAHEMSQELRRTLEDVHGLLWWPGGKSGACRGWGTRAMLAENRR